MERYYIRNCIGEIVGNPKGYTTYKGANMIFNRRTMQADLIDLAHKYGIEGSSGVNSVLIGSIKLESPTVTVLRVENKDGFGMYSDLWFRLCDLPNTEAHPVVMNDSLYQKALKAHDDKHGPLSGFASTGWIRGFEPRGHRFGFLDQDMLRRWIYDDSWVTKLSDAGAVLCTYIVEADHAIVGRTQVTFRAENAKCVNRMPLAKIL